jgi:hypothetical protein
MRLPSGSTAKWRTDESSGGPALLGERLEVIGDPAARAALDHLVNQRLVTAAIRVLSR